MRARRGALPASQVPPKPPSLAARPGDLARRGGAAVRASRGSGAAPAETRVRKPETINKRFAGQGAPPHVQTGPPHLSRQRRGRGQRRARPRAASVTRNFTARLPSNVMGRGGAAGAARTIRGRGGAAIVRGEPTASRPRRGDAPRPRCQETPAAGRDAERPRRRVESGRHRERTAARTDGIEDGRQRGRMASRADGSEDGQQRERTASRADGSEGGRHREPRREGDAVGESWIFQGDGSRHRRGVPRGYSVWGRGAAAVGTWSTGSTGATSRSRRRGRTRTNAPRRGRVQERRRRRSPGPWRTARSRSIRARA